MSANLSSRTTEVAAITALLFASGCSSSGTSNAWEIESKKDPMSDAEYTTATTRLVGENADFDLVAMCGQDGEVYRFRAFDKSGDPLDFSSPATAGPLERRMQVRLDDRPPAILADFSSRYSNQLELRPPRTRGLGRAQRLTVRMALTNGTETLTIDQTGSEFRALMKPCIDYLDARKAALAQEKAEQAATQAAEPAPEPTPSSAQCWTPPSGPHVLDDPDRAISFQEIQEIESVTGRPYQEGDSIYGKAEDRCPR